MSSRKTEKKVLTATKAGSLAVTVDPLYPDPESAARGDRPMTVVEHLNEFRSRLIACIGTLAAIIAVGLFFSDQLLVIAAYPFNGTGLKLNIFTLTGGFMVRLKVAGVTGMVISIPLIIAQVWRFAIPAVDRENRTFFRVSVSMATLLFYGGAAFVFFGIAPVLIRTLLAYVSPGMTTMIGIDEYLMFILSMAVALGAIFEMPIIIMTLTRLGIVTPIFLLKKRKYAIFLIWIVAAIITPQDIVAQIFVAIPLMILYEVSIIVSRFVVISKKKRELRRLTR